MLAVGLIARRSKTALMLLAPIPLALIGWLILDASAPILLPRYMASVTALAGDRRSGRRGGSLR